MEDFSSCFFSLDLPFFLYLISLLNLKASLLTDIVGICILAAYVNHEVTITFVFPKCL